MSELKKMASDAAEQVEILVADMLEGDYPDNEVLLGDGLCGDKAIQVQLYVTQDNKRFVDDHGCRPYGRERFLDWSKELPTQSGFYLWREIGTTTPHKMMAYVTRERNGQLSVEFNLLANEVSNIQDVAAREWFKIPQ